jgi:hypothetical protein
VLALEELEVTGSVLERGKPARAAATALRATAPVERRDGRGRADEPSEQEGP